MERGGKENRVSEIHKAMDGFRSVSDRYHLPFSDTVGHSDPDQSETGVSGSLPAETAGKG